MSQFFITDAAGNVMYGTRASDVRYEKTFVCLGVPYTLCVSQAMGTREANRIRCFNATTHRYNFTKRPMTADRVRCFIDAYFGMSGASPELPGELFVYDNTFFAVMFMLFHATTPYAVPPRFFLKKSDTVRISAVYGNCDRQRTCEYLPIDDAAKLRGCAPFLYRYAVNAAIIGGFDVTFPVYPDGFGIDFTLPFYSQARHRVLAELPDVPPPLSVDEIYDAVFDTMAAFQP